MYGFVCKHELVLILPLLTRITIRSAFYGAPKPDPERMAMLDKCYDLGEWHWDSADMYMDSEDLLGRWFKENPKKRKDIFLATKFANKMDAEGNRSIDSTPEYCKEACERSLQRLGVDHIDLYYCHRLDGKTPIEHTVRAMAELKNQGKIKYLGLSECSSESLRRAYKVHPITAVQIEYSPWALDIENPQIALMHTCRELGVASKLLPFLVDQTSTILTPINSRCILPHRPRLPLRLLQVPHRYPRRRLPKILPSLQRRELPQEPQARQ